MRLVIIDDHPIFREGVALTLAVEQDLAVVGQGESAADAVQLARALTPDILLLDIDIPGGGLAVLSELFSASPKTRVIVLTAATSETHLLAALRAGVQGYVLKGVSARQLANIIRGVHAGESYVSPNLAAHVLTQKTLRPPAAILLDELTEREHQILDMVAQGATNRQIAHALHITENTVKNSMTRIMEKLQVHNRVEAAMLTKRIAP